MASGLLAPAQSVEPLFDVVFWSRFITRFGFGGEGGGWMQFATEKRDENLAVLGVFLRKNWSKGSLEARSHGQDSCIQIKPLLLTSKVSYHVARGIAPG